MVFIIKKNSLKTKKKKIEKLHKKLSMEPHMSKLNKQMITF